MASAFHFAGGTEHYSTMPWLRCSGASEGRVPLTAASPLVFVGSLQPSCTSRVMHLQQLRKLLHLWAHCMLLNRPFQLSKGVKTTAVKTCHCLLWTHPEYDLAVNFVILNKERTLWFSPKERSMPLNVAGIQHK